MKEATAMNYHAPINTSTPDRQQAIPVHGNRKTTFAAMPKTREHWETCYSVPMADDRFEPRVCIGEQMIFDPTAEAEVGSIAAVWFGPTDDPAFRLVGVITARTCKTVSLALSLDKDEPPFRIRTSTTEFRAHPCIAVMTPMLTAAERAQATRNMDLRRASTWKDERQGP